MIVQKENRILIAVDEEFLAHALELRLEKEGYAFDWIPNAEEALKRLFYHSYSLALLDIDMSEMDGVDVLKRLRNSDCNAAVIITTAHGNENIAVACMKGGAADYIAKPFEMSDMMQRIEQALFNRESFLKKEHLEQEKDDFVSMLSHDMKNPLTAAIGSIGIIKEGCLGTINDEQSEYLQSAIDSCKEVSFMIDGLVNVYRCKADMTRLNAQPCDIGDIIAPSISKFGHLAKHKKITLISEVETELPKLIIDKNAFLRSIDNLLANALKFSSENHEIFVSCYSLTQKMALKMAIPDYAAKRAKSLLGKHERFVRFGVRDTGVGIPAEDQESIFKRFIQSRYNGAYHVGVGLGLAYCKLAIEKMGGVIWVESILGQGSEFIVLLPIFEKEAGSRIDG